LTPHHSSLRLAFAGTPPFAVPALDALCAAGHQVSAVYTQADRPAGRGRSLHQSAVKRRAVELGIPVHQPESFKSPQAQESLRALDLDALVVAAYGLILPPEALAIPREGCLNIHASLLPRWRGAAPIQRAILAGDTRTGITIMRMEAGLDTGPMLLARAIEIDSRDTSKSLHDRLARLGAQLICEALDDLQRGRLHEQEQPAAGVCYAPKIEKSEALIDWREDAEAIERKVRAFDPWPVAETRFHGEQLRIWEAQVMPPSNGAPAIGTGTGTGTEHSASPEGTVLAASKLGIDVACGRGVLRATKLQLPGRKPVSAQQLAAAQPLAGARFTSA
jgi:methionyl-tRNA formyltransferase